MGKAVLTPAARGDLDDIWAFSATRWGVSKVEAYIRRIAQQLEAIAERPSIGRPCPHIRAGYYKFLCQQHLVFYRATPPGIEVVRILHGRMDIEQHL